MVTKTAKTWTCVGCGEQNDPMDRVCEKCGSDGRATIGGAFTDERLAEAGIPTSQAAAAAKEAAAGGPKVRCLRVGVSKATGFDSRIVVDRTGERWKFTYDFQTAAGEDGPTASLSLGTESYDCEEAAVDAAFNAFVEWLDLVATGHPKLAPKVRKAKAETDIHRHKLIGAWLQKQKAASIERSLNYGKAAPAAAEILDSRPLAERVNTAPVEQLELARIRQSPDNMRREYDAAALQELADSLKQDGLLHAITVFKAGKDWELIAGERRYRAAKIAKLTTIPCRVIPCSSIEAKRLRIVENLKRTDLTAVEEARGYQILLSEHGYTQERLGQEIGVHQSTIANRIRLLRLAAPLQELIIQRATSESHARELVSLPENPKLAAHMAKAVKEEIRDEGSLPALPRWPGWVYSTAKEIVRPVDPKAHYSFQDEKTKQYRYGQVQFTEKLLEQHGADLEVVVLASPYDKRKERYALNLKKWDELHEPLEVAKKERDSKKGNGAGSAAKADRAEPTPAELAQRKREQARQLAGKIDGYRNEWLQKQLSAKCATLTDEPGLRLLLAFAGMDGNRGKRGEALEQAVKAVAGKGGPRSPIRMILALPAPKLIEVARGTLGRFLAQTVADYGNDMKADDLPAIAELLDVDVARDWRLDEAFLLLHTKDQLADLWKEWKVAEYLGDRKRTEIVNALLKVNANRQLPAPKSLVKGGAK